MKSWNFMAKILSCLLGVSLLMLLTTAVVLAPRMQNIMRSNYHETMRLTLDMVSQNVENTLNYYEEMAYLISGNDELNQWLLANKDEHALRYEHQISSFLSSNILGNRYVRSVVIHGVNGQIYSYSRYNELGVNYLATLITPETYLTAGNGSSFHWFYDSTQLPLSQAESRESRILLTGVIKNRSEVYKNEVIATFIIEYDTNILLKLYETADFDGLGTIQTWDLTQPVYPVIQTYKDTVDDTLRQAVEDAAEAPEDDILAWDNTLIATQTIDSTGWELVGIVDADGIRSKVAQLKEDLYAVLVLELVMAALLSLMLSFQVNKPIKELMGYMKKVEGGNLSVQIPVRRKDEFGQLSMQFNHMVEQLDDLIREVYEVKASEREAQIAAMRAQMNPHFLYNTLDGISWTVNFGKNDEACEMIACLGDILRYSIKGSEFVTVRDEVQQAANYLYIQKKRMGEMLQYQISISEEIMECKVLKFFLQPIVENAVVHGICGLGCPGEIRICANVYGEDLQIFVCDNGRGIDPERIAGILAGTAATSEGHMVIGLSNVNRRIQLVYGKERYGINIESSHSGTKVIVTLPLQF